MKIIGKFKSGINFQITLRTKKPRHYNRALINFGWLL